MQSAASRGGSTASWLRRVLPKQEVGTRACILLNTPISEDLLAAVWEASQLRICADGGADRLRAVLPTLHPELVVGDLDSATKATLDLFRDRGSVILDLHEDQDSTDLDKALKAASTRNCDTAYVLGDFSGGYGGRTDHMFGIVQSIYRATITTNQLKEVLVISDSAILRVLGPNQRHVIEANVGSKCGLVPMFGPCEGVTTSGLCWDLDDARLAFGELVSTSNMVHQEAVVVETSDTALLWTMTLGVEP